MNLDSLALIALVLAAVPAGLFALNLLAYRPITRPTIAAAVDRETGVSVLIPARNEEQNIRATLERILANCDCKFEIIVLDDHSTDRTAAIVGEFAARDPHVRLESAPPLPAGWCGKQHACHVLAGLARKPLLVFIDADVRLAPDALTRLAMFTRQTGTDLASGVPQQKLGTFSERLLIPQIHFILLGFLPMHFMRRSFSPAFAAGCGQLFVARRTAYEATGGHAMICWTLHDGVKLPRLFRRHGFRTELFDATDLATCRMYHTDADTWRGLGKNATEGLATPSLILPMTALLFGGQILPFILLARAYNLSPTGFVFALAAGALAYAPRLLAISKFQQPLGSALLHPLGVLALLSIQWWARLRQFAGKPSVWKGRSYSPTAIETPGSL